LYFEAGEKIDNKEYEAGYALLTKCATAGHGGCAEILGWAFYQGTGIVEDKDKAIKWLKLAYESGVNNGFAGLSGALSIAEFYCDDSYFLKSKDEVIKWNEKAANLYFELMEVFTDIQKLEYQELFVEISDRIIKLENEYNEGVCNNIQNINND
jgi:TPR repeat protein